MAVVYIHKRLDNNDVFYVGIGLKESRAWQKKFRNDHWRSIVNKHGFSYEIIHKDITWEEACEIEIALIRLYGRKCDGGTLCNITSGGDGVVGVKWTYEHRRKISDGNKGKVRTEEARKNISTGRSGIIFSNEHRNNISKAKKGIKLSDETRAKMSLAKIGSAGKRPKLTLDLETGIFYDSLTNACRATNRKYGTECVITRTNRKGQRFAFV